jgi:hypothetical protein
LTSENDHEDVVSNGDESDVASRTTDVDDNPIVGDSNTDEDEEFEMTRLKALSCRSCIVVELAKGRGERSASSGHAEPTLLSVERLHQYE